MKEKLLRGLLTEIAWVLLIALLSGWFSFAYTYLNDTNWDKDECVCGGDLTEIEQISDETALYECEDCRRVYSSDTSLKEIARRKQ